MIALRTTFLLTALAVTGSTLGHAQTMRHPQLDFAVSYIAEHGNPVASGGNFWLQGGSAELGTNSWHGLGIAANVTGTHTKGFGPSNIPLGLVSTTFGPRFRYRLRGQSLSVFGEGLIGEVHGFDSLFPSRSGADSSASALALQVGGGVDFGLSRHFAVRAVQANWARFQLPNSTTNVQNDLRLGAGLVVKF